MKKIIVILICMLFVGASVIQCINGQQFQVKMQSKETYNSLGAKELLSKMMTGTVVRLYEDGSRRFYRNASCEDDGHIIREDIVFSKPVLVSNGLFVNIKLDEANSDICISHEPILPKHNVIFELPFGTEILDVECSISSISSMVLSRKVSPAPESLTEESLVINSDFIFGKVYESIDLYPSTWYSFHEGGGLDGKDHVTYLSIQLYPVRYSPKINKISFAREFSIEVKYKEPVQQTFKCKNSMDAFDLLIISPTEFSGNILPLVAHKNKYDISTKMITLDEIYSGSYFPVQGRDYAEKIKYFIKNAIENWDISYVFLIGGCDKLPVRLVSSARSNLFPVIPTFISDLYYADIYSSNGSFCSWDSNNNGDFGEIRRALNGDGILIDGMDFYPDVYIGRIPCNTSDEVDIVVNKIMSYEQDTYDQSWFKNLLLCGGDTFGAFGGSFVSIVIEWLGGYHASEGIYTCENVSSIMHGFNPIKLYANSIFKSKNPPLPENINKAINDGAGFVLFSGHGNQTKWYTHPPLLMFIDLIYKSSDITNLHNDNKLPIVVLEACSNGDYSKESGVPTPIAWEFVKKEGGGAIATFATTTYAWGTIGTVCLVRVSGYITFHLFQAYSSGRNTPAMMLAQAQTDYLNNNVEYHEWVDYATLEEWVLFGDPSLKIGGYPS